MSYYGIYDALTRSFVVSEGQFAFESREYADPVRQAEFEHIGRGLFLIAEFDEEPDWEGIRAAAKQLSEREQEGSLGH